MSSSWGERIRVSIFGGSHTKAIGVNIDGLPAGEAIDWEEILKQMSRRAPGQDLTATTRKEEDSPEVLCGLLEGVTTGAPLCAIIKNTSQRSKDYSQLKRLPRPGHADYTAFVKYGGHNDVRGGGHFSGRLTAPLVFAGAIARQMLARRGITVGSHVTHIAACGRDDPRFDPVTVSPELLKRLSESYFPVIDPEVREEMRTAINQARMDQDSVGGLVECAILGMPVGVGNPMFGGTENLIASLVFGIPAVKGIEFGAGFAVADMRGSENNDPFYMEESGLVRTETNHSGGILGGITNGMPLIFTVALKPTSSISREQDTVNLETGENSKLAVTGRHDPCIVPRGAPAVEAAACLAALELLAQSGMLS
ncbi:chorismate synthase [Acutalibacter sp. 1XD8-33]|uniref:chorismate synthase n=1 Tax=Acutalibacter sp. 1XD8-33 TaxID=2320081 RepID=UPI000EA1CDDC|nr:chorismate synthase [Acutalibacter sp. 1XD8-33]RKJ40332.1 chorismate synthase [Acutalibacter sp. 1XD8-33]